MKSSRIRLFQFGSSIKYFRLKSPYYQVYINTK